MNLVDLANRATRGLRAYDPGHDLVALRRRFGADNLAELGSNETPWGPSPAVMHAITAALGELHRYPDPLGGDLKRALAAHHGVDPQSLILGNGSHELLMLIAQAFAEAGDEIVFSRYGFAVFAIATQAAGARAVVVDALGVDAGMPRGHDLRALRNAVSPATRLIYLSNPNNPTGTWFPRAELIAFLADLPEHVITVVDEAYGEFLPAEWGGGALDLVREFPRLLVTRTFSKAYALAGLRVGYAHSSPDLIAVLERLRESFNVNGLALAAAQAALADGAHLAQVLARTERARARLFAIAAAHGITASPSATNFVLWDFGRDARPIEAALFNAGVIARPMGGYGLPDCLRISVGDDAALDRLERVLPAALEAG